MNALKSLSLGAVIGLLFGVCHICSVADHEMAEAEERLARIEEDMVPATTLSVEEAFEEDSEAIYLDWVADQNEVIEVETWKPYECVPLSDELQTFMKSRCDAYGIDYSLALALMESESNFEEDAEGDTDIGGSYGLFQINNIWWDAMESKGLDIFKTTDNIEAGLMILSSYLDKYQDEATAVQMYKCGESRGREFLSAGVVLEQCKAVVERAKEIEAQR